MYMCVWLNERVWHIWNNALLFVLFLETHIPQNCFPLMEQTDGCPLKTTVAYLGHGEKTNYSANPPGRNTNPPGRNSQSGRAE